MVRSLKAKALDYYLNLSLDSQDSYSKLCSALEGKYGTEGTSWERKEQLLCTIQKANESAKDFADRLSMGGKANFSALNEEEMNEMLTSRFLSGLLDQALAREVQKFDPSTLDEAVKKLHIVGKAMVGSGHKFSRSGRDAVAEVEVRQVTGPTDAGSKPLSEPKASADRNVLSLLEKILQKLDSGSPSVDKRPPLKNTLKCYACGETGHMARNCKLHCTACDRRGHLANNCRKKRAANPAHGQNQVEEQPAHLN